MEEKQNMSFSKYPNITLKEHRENREAAKALFAKNVNPISEIRIEKASESLTL